MLVDNLFDTVLDTMSDSLELFNNSDCCSDMKGGWLSTTDEKQIDTAAEASAAGVYPLTVMDTSNTLDAISEILLACDVAENNTTPCTHGKHRYCCSFC